MFYVCGCVCGVFCVLVVDFVVVVGVVWCDDLVWLVCVFVYWYVCWYVCWFCVVCVVVIGVFYVGVCDVVFW